MPSQLVEVIIRGRLSNSLVPDLEKFTITPRADGTTRIAGRVADQTELVGVLGVFADLRLEVVTVTVEEGAHE